MSCKKKKDEASAPVVLIPQDQGNNISAGSGTSVVDSVITDSLGHFNIVDTLTTSAQNMTRGLTLYALALYNLNSYTNGLPSYEVVYDLDLQHFFTSISGTGNLTLNNIVVRGRLLTRTFIHIQIANEPYDNLDVDFMDSGEADTHFSFNREPNRHDCKCPYVIRGFKFCGNKRLYHPRFKQLF